jgi:hypothetical protein
MKEKVNPLPVSFKEFSKEPVKAILFMSVLAIGYLYIDNKMTYNEQIEMQGKKIDKLEAKIDILTMQLKKSDSLLASAASKLATLHELGKIK